MPKYTPEEQAAKTRLAANRLQVRRLLVAENYDGALAHAKEHGFDVFAARLPAVYNNEAEPFFQKLEIRLGLPPAPPPPFAGQAVLDAKAARLAEEAKQSPAPEQAEELPPEAPTMQPMTEAAPVAVEEQQRDSQPAPEPTPVPVGEVNGWPTRTPATVYRFCLNKQLVVIQLPDGRTASMWRSFRNWQLGDKLTATLCTAESADPMYQWIKTG